MLFNTSKFVAQDNLRSTAWFPRADGKLIAGSSTVRIWLRKVCYLFPCSVTDHVMLWFWHWSLLFLAFLCTLNQSSCHWRQKWVYADVLAYTLILIKNTMNCTMRKHSLLWEQYSMKIFQRSWIFLCAADWSVRWSGDSCVSWKQKRTVTSWSRRHVEQATSSGLYCQHRKRSCQL